MVKRKSRILDEMHEYHGWATSGRVDQPAPHGGI